MIADAKGNRQTTYSIGNATAKNNNDGVFDDGPKQRPEMFAFSTTKSPTTLFVKTSTTIRCPILMVVLLSQTIIAD
jgi:hypothetical protein